jgi:hypothetical protein
VSSLVLGKKAKQEIRNLRAVNDVVLAVFQCVLVLFKGKECHTASLFDCRDFISTVDFDSLSDTIIGGNRIRVVKKKLLDMGKDMHQVERINRNAAQILEWVLGCIGCDSSLLEQQQLVMDGLDGDDAGFLGLSAS